MPLPSIAPVAAPLFAPPFAPPVVAPGPSVIVPFIRRTLPRAAPLVPLTPPPLPVLPPLTVTAPSPAAGGLLRAAPLGAAMLGAFVGGLAIGNFVYEDVLGRPFGASIGDLLFPAAQPMPVPVPEPVPVGDPFGQCETRYFVTHSHTAIFSWTNRDEGYKNIITELTGPIGGIRAAYGPDNLGLEVFIQTGLGEVSVVGRGGYWMGTPTATINALVRSDALPDDCAVYGPSPHPEPRAIPRPTLPRPSEIRPFRLPPTLPAPARRLVPPFLPSRRPDPRILPGPGRDFEPLWLPTPITTPVFRGSAMPLPVPTPRPDPTRYPDGRLRATRTPTPGYECCPSLEQKLDEVLDRDECEPCDLSGIEEQLREIAERLAVSGIGSVDLTPCDAEEEVIEVYQGEGIEGVFAAIDAITQSLNLIHENTRCDTGECVSAVPDWWQVRKGAGTPQLSVVLRKHGTKNYHSLNIPHPITEPRPTRSPIAPYTAGNWQATIYCTDNSKFIVNAKTKTEAVRVATEAAALIKPAFLPSPLQIATTERRGFAINTSIMHPRYLDYFSEGQKGRRPDWRVNLD